MLSISVWAILFVTIFFIGMVAKKGGIGLTVPFILSGVAWTLWYFFVGGYKHFWINPESDTAVILQDYFQTPPKSLKDSEVTGPLFVPKGQEAVFTGINPKFPWQIPVGNPISLKTVSPFEDTTVASDKGGVRYLIGFKVLLSPVRSEYLPRFLLTDDKNAGDYFKSEIGKAIRSAFENEEDGDVIVKNHQDFTKKYIEPLFGGLSEICNEENRYGRFSNSPFIVSVQRHPDDQDVAQIPTIIKEISSGVDELTKKGIPSGQVTPLIMAALGQRVQLENISVDMGGNKPKDSSTINPLPLAGKRRKK